MNLADMPPVEAALALVGKTLQIGRQRVTITEALARGKRDNERWLDSKPLFGAKPVDVYVAPYRGSHLLFLRTRPGTCVRIESAAVQNVQLMRPGQVTKHFNIRQERTGDLVINGDTLKINWHRRPRTFIAN